MERDRKMNSAMFSWIGANNLHPGGRERDTRSSPHASRRYWRPPQASELEVKVFVAMALGFD